MFRAAGEPAKPGSCRPFEVAAGVSCRLIHDGGQGEILAETFQMLKGVPRSPKYANQRPFGLFLEDFGSYFTYFWGLGRRLESC